MIYRQNRRQQDLDRLLADSDDVAGDGDDVELIVSENPKEENSASGSTVRNLVERFSTLETTSTKLTSVSSMPTTGRNADGSENSSSSRSARGITKNGSVEDLPEGQVRLQSDSVAGSQGGGSSGATSSSSSTQNLSSRQFRSVSIQQRMASILHARAGVLPINLPTSTAGPSPPRPEPLPSVSVPQIPAPLTRPTLSVKSRSIVPGSRGLQNSELPDVKPQTRSEPPSGGNLPPSCSTDSFSPNESRASSSSDTTSPKERQPLLSHGAGRGSKHSRNDVRSPSPSPKHQFIPTSPGSLLPYTSALQLRNLNGGGPEPKSNRRLPFEVGSGTDVEAREDEEEEEKRKAYEERRLLRDLRRWFGVSARDLKEREMNIFGCSILVCSIILVLLVSSFTLDTTPADKISSNDRVGEKGKQQSFPSSPSPFPHLPLSYIEPLKGWLYHSKAFMESAANRTCWSIHERHWLYPPSKHAPTENFLSALREYEEMHKRCVSGIPDWLEYSKSYKGSDCRYLLWFDFPDVPLPSRLLSLLSAFLYSLLTQRALLVDTEGGMRNLLCPPFPSSSWWMDRSLKASFWNAAHQGEWVNGSTSNWNQVPFDRHDVMCFHWMSDANDYPCDLQFFCESMQRRVERDALWVVYKSDQYLVPSFYLLSRFHTKLNYWFPSRSILTNLARYLFHPSNSVWERVLRSYFGYMRGSERKIGLELQHLPPFEEMRSNERRDEEKEREMDGGGSQEGTREEERGGEEAVGLEEGIGEGEKAGEMERGEERSDSGEVLEREEAKREGEEVWHEEKAGENGGGEGEKIGGEGESQLSGGKNEGEKQTGEEERHEGENQGGEGENSEREGEGQGENLGEGENSVSEGESQGENQAGVENGEKEGQGQGENQKEGENGENEGGSQREDQGGGNGGETGEVDNQKKEGENQEGGGETTDEDQGENRERGGEIQGGDGEKREEDQREDGKGEGENQGGEGERKQEGQVESAGEGGGVREGEGENQGGEQITVGGEGERQDGGGENGGGEGERQEGQGEKKASDDWMRKRRRNLLQEEKGGQVDAYDLVAQKILSCAAANSLLPSFIGDVQLSKFLDYSSQQHKEKFIAAEETGGIGRRLFAHTNVLPNLNGRTEERQIEGAEVLREIKQRRSMVTAGTRSIHEKLSRGSFPNEHTKEHLDMPPFPTLGRRELRETREPVFGLSGGEGGGEQSWRVPKRNTISVFVSSQNLKPYLAMKRALGERPMEDHSVVTVHSDSQEESNAGLLSALQKQMAEIWLLSMCDVLITSYNSPWGYLAAGIANKPTYLLLNSLSAGEDKLNGPGAAPERGTCERTWTNEGCSVVPPRKLVCSTDPRGDGTAGEVEERSSSDTTTWHPFVRPCQDDLQGLTLMPGFDFNSSPTE